MRGAVVQRAANVDLRWQSGVRMGQLKWEIALPNGLYQVKVGIGETGRREPRMRIDAEGEAILDIKPQPNQSFVESTGEVAVRDGRLTIENTTPNNRTLRLCFIEITSSNNARPLWMPGVVLRDGSVYGGVKLTGGDQRQLRFTRDGREFTVAVGDIARVVFRPLGQIMVEKVPAGQTGVLLNSGDFFQGEFNGMDNGKIKLMSLIFGPSSFAPESEAAALILQVPRSPASEYRVRTADGSVYLVKSVALDQGNLIVEDPRWAS